MSAAAIRAEMHGAGVRLSLRRDGSLDLAAEAPPPPELLERARQHRDGLVRLLREEQDDSEAEDNREAPAPDPLPINIPDPDPALAGYLRAALRRPPSWSGTAPPTPGCFCSCCGGQRWWTEARGGHGWRCCTCHPPDHLPTEAVRQASSSPSPTITSEHQETQP